MITPWPNKRCYLAFTHNMPFENFWHEVANKKHLSMQSLSLHKLKFPVKRQTFFRLQDSVGISAGYYTGNVYFFLCRKMNALKIIWNWGSKQFNLKFFKSFTIYHVSKIKGMGIIWPTTWSYICIYLCSYFTYLMMHLRFSTLILYLILK